MLIFNNEADRNKYWNSNGRITELGKAGEAKLSNIVKEREQYTTSSKAPDGYNDWIIQLLTILSATEKEKTNRITIIW
jgi:hypothetical protein